jgi:hypothetical protein
MTDSHTISFELTGDTMLWKYPADSFSTTASILVSANQTVVLTQNGKAYDVLDMGIYTPDAETLPLLFDKIGIKAGYSGMIEAEIWFVSLLATPVQHWQATKDEPLLLPVAGSRNAALTAGGSVSIAIRDAAAFLQHTEPSGSSYTSAQAFELVRKDLLASLQKILAAKMQKDKIAPAALRPPYDTLSGFCQHYYNENIMSGSGYRLSAFVIDSIDYQAPAMRPPAMQPADDRDTSPVPYGRIMAVIAVMLVIIGIVLIAKHKISTDESADKRVGDLIPYKMAQNWLYVDTGANVTKRTGYKEAELISDQDLQTNKNERYVDAILTVKLSLGDVIYDSTSHLSFEINTPFNYTLKPFLVKRQPILKARFDSDTTMQLPLDHDFYVEGSSDFPLSNADLLIPRLKKSHKFTLLFTTAAHPDSTVQYTFHTAGLKWGGN